MTGKVTDPENDEAKEL